MVKWLINNHLIVELNTILNLMANYRLTESELMLVYLTFLAQDEQGGHAEYFVKWLSNGGQERLRSLFESLKEKGIIKKNYNPDSYIPNEIEFNKNFLKSWVKNTGEMGKELFDNYPPFLNVGNKLYPLKNIAKKYNSLEEFYFAYSSAIKHSIDSHKEIMELLEWGKENGHINYSILEFVISRKWLELKELRDNGIDGQITTSDSIYLDD